MPNIKIYSDGACRGNPGPAGCGYIIYADGQEIATGTKFLGTATNNIAEYTALLEAAKDPILAQFDSYDFYLDSELVVKQMTGIYKLKNEKLIPLKLEIDKVIAGKNVTFNHVLRHLNKEADKLANLAIDRKG